MVLDICGTYQRLGGGYNSLGEPGWKSHKFGGAGLRYEIGISIEYGDIVWWNGPFPCGAFPDIKIFKQSLKHMMNYGEKAEADSV